MDAMCAGQDNETTTDQDLSIQEAALRAAISARNDSMVNFSGPRLVGEYLIGFCSPTPSLPSKLTFSVGEAEG